MNIRQCACWQLCKLSNNDSLVTEQTFHEFGQKHLIYTSDRFEFSSFGRKHSRSAR